MKRIILCLMFIPVLSFASNEVFQPEKLRENLGLQAYLPSGKIKDIKVAILDNGFDGFQKDKGMLPATAELTQLTSIPPAQTAHGLSMAQIIWSITGKLSDGPKFYLVNTNGFSNLKAAVDFVIQQKIDIVLYSQTWSFGSNFDGTGFINALVTKAVQSGVVWINAAGNNGGMVYNGWINKQQDPSGQFLLFNGKDYLKFENKLDENNVTVTLSWTDFKESELYNTPKDLDLYIYNEKGILVGSSELIQKGEAPKPGEPSQLSSHAREVANLSGLDRGNYQIKIKIKSKNFENQDRFRVLLKADKEIDFTDKTSGSEIMPPADNPNAFAIGATDNPTAVGPTFDGRVKPDVWIANSHVAFTNGEEVQGTSSAAALLVGVLAVLKSEAPTLNNEGLRKYFLSLGNTEIPPDLVPSQISILPEWVKNFVPTDARVMLHRAQNYPVVLTSSDPIEIQAIKMTGINRVLPNDLILASPQNQRWYAFPMAQKSQIKSPWVEFRKGNLGQAFWKTPTLQELGHIAK